MQHQMVFLATVTSTSILELLIANQLKLDVGLLVNQTMGVQECLP